MNTEIFINFLGIFAGALIALFFNFYLELREKEWKDKHNNDV